MSEYSKNLSLIIGSILVIFSLAFFIPISFVALESPEKISITQDEGEQRVISASVISTATTISTTGGGVVNITLVDTDSGDSNSTGELSEGDSIVLTINGGTVTITNNNIIDGSTAFITYEFPLFVGWPDGAQTVVENMQFLIVFTAILLLIGVLILVMRGFNNGN